MGAWGSGPFDNDAAADFLGECHTSPSRFLSKTLRRIANTPAGTYIDVDDGGAGWAACELVALAFGYGDTAALDDNVVDLVAKLPPKEEQRLLALEVLPRIADVELSELAGLWHEGDGADFDTALADLRARLLAASEGPRELPKAKTGDVITLPAAPPSTELLVMQVVGPGEVAVFEGVCTDETAVQSMKGRRARRVPTWVNTLLRRGRRLGNVPLRKDLKGKKLYTGEAGAIDDYILATASGGGVRSVSYAEAREHDLLRHHDEDALRAVALGAKPVQRVRSPDEREAELRAQNATKWATRREETTPDPFGDVAILERFVHWIEQFGVENAVRRFHEEAAGSSGYGRPNEDPERRSYAFAGIVALWRETWSRNVWPAALAGRLPAAPDKELMNQALNAARILAAQVLTRDAELKLIWDGAPDHGAELRASVASLQKALA